MSSFETDANIRELHQACKDGSADIVKHLLQQKVRASSFDPRGRPPIVVAAVHGNAACVRLLCQHKILVDQQTYKSGDTALTLVLASFVAANTMPVPGLYEAEQHARADKKRRARNARLEEVVVTLLQLGADPSTPRPSATPLHIASHRGFDSAVRLLLSGRYYHVNDYGERITPSVSAVDAFGRTPLHRASTSGHGDVAATLLGCGADPLARDKSGKSSLQVGIELGRDAFVRSVLNIWCRESYAGVNVSMHEMMRRIQLMQEEIHRPCGGKRQDSPSRSKAKATSATKPDRQSSLIMAEGNAKLVGLLLKGPTCLQDVMAAQVRGHRDTFLRKKQVRAAAKHIRDLMRARRDRQIGRYGAEVTTSSKYGPVKEKSEPKWLYMDDAQGGKVLGPVTASKMRDWWQQGKLDLGMRVWSVPDTADAAMIDGPPDAGAMCNMPARGQGPSALGAVWNPKALPHRMRTAVGDGKFRPLREIIVERGGVDKTFGSSNASASVSLATKLLIKSKKWKRKASKSAFSQKLAAIRAKFPELLEEPEKKVGGGGGGGGGGGEIDDDEAWKTVPEEGDMTEDEEDFAEEEEHWIAGFRAQQRENLWVGAKMVEMPDSGSFGRTALANACAAGWYDVAAQLLHYAHARTDARDRYGFTPLALACQQGHVDIVRLLLETLKKEHRERPQQDAEDQPEGAFTVSAAAVRPEARPTTTNILRMQDGSYHWTPLTWASTKGHLEIVRLLLEAGADPEGETQSPASGPLGAACSREDNEKVVKLLVKAGADVNRVGGESGKITPLHAGCAQGNTATVKALLKSSKRVIMDPRDANSCTPLMLACRGGHLKCVRMLMDRGADWRMATKTGNWTPLMYAAEGGFTKIVYRLLHWKRKPRTDQSLYAPPDGHVKHGDDPQSRLEAPAPSNVLEVAQQGIGVGGAPSLPGIPVLPSIPGLVSSSSSPASPPSSSPSLPSLSGSLHNLALGRLAAASIKHKAALRVVERNQGFAPTTQHYHGMAYSPSADAVASKLGMAPRCVKEKYEQAGAIKKEKIDRSHFGRAGSTLSRHKLEMVCMRESHTGCNALHLAARFGYTGVLKHLLMCRLPPEVIDARSNTNQTPLGSACCFGHLECAEILLEAGANIEMRQGDLETGPTPLLQAAAGGYMQIIIDLVARGADMEVENANRQTAQMLAGENGHKEVFAWLMAQRKLAQRAKAKALRLQQEAEEAAAEVQRRKMEARLEKERAFRAAAVRANQEMRRKERERIAAEEAERELKRREEKKKKKKKKRKKKKKKPQQGKGRGRKKETAATKKKNKKSETKTKKSRKNKKNKN